MSLNRRVYTWFLSGNDTSESQIAYFKTNGLDLLSGTLKGDMEKLSAAADMAEAQAPFKVFLSLLDKWEIGETLSLNLAIPSLHAIQAASKGVDGSEVCDTVKLGTDVRSLELGLPCTSQLNRASCGRKYTRGSTRNWSMAIQM